MQEEWLAHSPVSPAICNTAEHDRCKRWLKNSRLADILKGSSAYSAAERASLMRALDPVFNLAWEGFDPSVSATDHWHQLCENAYIFLLHTDPCFLEAVASFRASVQDRRVHSRVLHAQQPPASAANLPEMSAEPALHDAWLYWDRLLPTRE